MNEALLIVGILLAVAGAWHTACHHHNHPDHHPRRRKEDR